MKALYFAFLACCVSLTCFTAQAADLKGAPARQLLNDLQGGGAFVDCGMGTCGTEAKDILCMMTGNSVGMRRYA